MKIFFPIEYLQLNFFFRCSNMQSHFLWNPKNFLPKPKFGKEEHTGYRSICVYARCPRPENSFESSRWFCGTHAPRFQTWLMRSLAALQTVKNEHMEGRLRVVCCGESSCCRIRNFWNADCFESSPPFCT